MFQHGGPQVQSQHQMYRQGLGGVSGGVASLAGNAPAGMTWVQLKTHPARQPGQPYRGTRFNRVTNKWLAAVSFHGREVDVSSHDHEEDAALAHDTKLLELYGATACVNFPYSGLVDSSTMRVHRLRTASGQEISLVPDKAKGFSGSGPANTSGQDTHYRSGTRPVSPSPGGVIGGGVLGVNRYAGDVDGGREPPPMPTRLPRAPIGVEGSLKNEWTPKSDRAYTAADSASVANAREHDASLVYEIVFPRPGAVGLNLRSYFTEPPAGARPGLSPYGCLEVIEAQSPYLQVVVETGDLLVSINGQKLSGRTFSFEDAIARCSRASVPRVLRFARMKGAASAEIDCAVEAEVCAAFDAVDGPPQRLVTAKLHPSAPPYFFLNPPTRQPRKVAPPPPATASGSVGAAGASVGAAAANAPSVSPATPASTSVTGAPPSTSTTSAAVAPPHPPLPPPPRPSSAASTKPAMAFSPPSPVLQQDSAVGGATSSQRRASGGAAETGGAVSDPVAS